MEQLKYTIEDTTIAELLGVQNFINKESAVLELIKNAYDADASNIQIIFKDNQLFISDDGKGMDKKDIYTNWMHVGKSNKGYKLSGTQQNNRVLAGSKGIGRFALARLGTIATVYSKKANCPAIKWYTDWHESIVEDLDTVPPEGTAIIISGLRDKWTEKSIKSLADYFGITYNDSLMNISIEFNSQIYTVEHYYNTPRLGKNCVSIIKLSYDNKTKTLRCEVNSDEFHDDARNFFPNTTSFQETLNIFEELQSDRDISITDDELNLLLTELGSFSSELYFSLKSSSNKEMEDFLYKHQKLDERYEHGVVLYRNAFSISSFEGKKDWLEFGKRSRKSPAAATHPTGSWRVRENQISGKVMIDKKENACLKDLSNRQGVEENVYYEIFIKILVSGIGCFERYRQRIIRAINKKNVRIQKTKTGLIDKIVNRPDTITKLTTQETQILVGELLDLQETAKDYKERNETTEQRYRYDVRILNVFATTGLKAAFIAHELQNDRNSIDTNYGFIVKALQDYDFWEELNSPENTRYEYKNVPKLLSKNKKINHKLLIFLDSMLTDIEKQKFIPVDLDISSTINDLVARWKRDYAWVVIDYIVEQETYFHTAEDIIIVILNNLILNSLQQNEEFRELNIKIICKKQGNYLFIHYSDQGVGLPPKYINDPYRILNVHETSRRNGHGIGMWVVNNTIEMTGGKVIDIDGHEGFSIKFEIGDNL